MATKRKPRPTNTKDEVVLDLAVAREACRKAQEALKAARAKAEAERKARSVKTRDWCAGEAQKET